MKKAAERVQQIIEGAILFGLTPLLGLFLIFVSIGFLVGSVQKDALTSTPLMFSGVLLIFGLGLLRFSYLVFFKKESRLSSGVIYVASILFMFMGVVAAILLIASPPKDLTAFQYGRAPGMFFIGLIGFRYARSRKGRTSRPSQRVSARSSDTRGSS